MPTVLREGPYRFFFFSGDRAEPPHVHVERENMEAKYWLDPVRFERSGGFNAVELLRIERLIDRNRMTFLERWNEFFLD